MQCCRVVNGIKNKNIKNSLGATWNASHLAVRLCALRHWKRVSMPLTTHSLRHPLTRAIHIAPRIKTARRSRRKTPDDKKNLGRRLYQISQNDFADFSNDSTSLSILFSIFAPVALETTVNDLGAFPREAVSSALFCLALNLTPASPLQTKGTVLLVCGLYTEPSSPPAFETCRRRKH